MRVWDFVRLCGLSLFAMAAGSAAYHQYIVHDREPVRVEPVMVYQMSNVQGPARLQEQEEPGGLPEDDLEGEAAMDELELLAICVEAEAGNQSLAGKRMVADVILNRVDDPDFPDSIEGVISQKNAFTSFQDGGMDRVTEISEETIRAVQMELEERSWPGLFYFTAGDWPRYGTPWKQVGDHYFNTK